ncbi:MAG: cell division protein FtsQ/DivIB [Gammaproteobacteria bacterium]|nr:cell division protein FtsQ/DivIB [Gammaproteobacteria bacterium]
MLKLVTSVVLIGLFVAGVMGWLALDQPVRVVRIEGELSAPERREVQAQIAGSLDARLLTLNLEKLRHQILALSWPRTVSLRRVWPDSLEVSVSKQMVVARWADGAFLTSSGEIVTTPDAPANVPTFDCDLSGPKRAMEIYRLLQELASRAGLNVVTLSENALGEWRIDLAGGLELMLGAEQLAERMRRFLLVYRRSLGDTKRRVEYVDARYANGVAVRWRESGGL